MPEVQNSSYNHRQGGRNVKGGRSRVSVLVLLIDILVYLGSLLFGIASRFSFEQIRYLLFHYSDGFYLIVILLSTLSYVALYVNDSRAREEIENGAPGENRSVIRRRTYKLGHDFVDQVKIVFRNHLVVFIALIMILFVVQASELLSRKIIAITFLLSFVIDIFVREIIRIVAQKHNDRQAQTVVVGGKILRIIPNGEQLPLEAENKKGAVTHVFAIGCKGIPAEYGGFETFMQYLTKYKENPNILYHVARIAGDEVRYEYHRSIVFDLHVPSLGSAKAIYYDIAALRRSISYCKKHKINNKTGNAPVFFIMACRIGPFIAHYKRQIHSLGGKLYINPDGHEWKRSKWSKPVQKYWKYSEGKMVKDADLLICDSKTIEKYIHDEYAEYSPKTTFIAYGAKVVDGTASAYTNDLKDDDAKSLETELDVASLQNNASNGDTALYAHITRLSDTYKDWCRYNNVTAGEYYLMVGRFVPENNYEAALREFMTSKSRRDLVIITTPNEKLSIELDQKLGWSADARIKFVGTVYDVDLLREIRLHAYAYIHGHSVGGTNPSLLESLGATDLNLLYDCGFNREVAEDSALYWSTENGSLAKLIDDVDEMPAEQRREFGVKAKARITEEYSWHKICSEYEGVFVS